MRRRARGGYSWVESHAEVRELPDGARDWFERRDAFGDEMEEPGAGCHLRQVPHGDGERVRRAGARKHECGPRVEP